HVYDVTYGSVRPGRDQLVVIDDSIVRGTTLHESILKMLARLQPRKIVMVSSAPQIRYPDFYGIDMARLEELCAFRAAIRLIEERGMQQLIDQTYTACKTHPTAENHVRHIYEPFSADDISRKIAQMLRPADLQTPVELVFQSIDGLHAAIPRHHGDWYFTGHYPTPGGTRMANQAFVQYYEESYQRSKSANHK
ncbi:MAG: amidophosphoribosyltransferase, partial [Bacteroidaceae bacterium]|nr:amidophosphoribosyltransferase [Bacteroidaceae bacterium]